MTYLNHYEIEIIAKERRDQALEWAAAQRMLRQLQGNHPGPVLRLSLRLLSRLGNGLVHVGQRLERLEMPPVVAAMEQCSACQGSTRN